MKLFTDKRTVQLINSFSILDNVKAFDKVKRDKLFEVLEKYFPNVLLKNIIEIYSGNKIKVKINIQLTEEHTINHGNRQGCPLSSTLFNIHTNEIIAKLNQIYIKGITLSTSTKLNTPLLQTNQS